MFLATEAPPNNRQQRNHLLKQVGVQYWYTLCQAGIPTPEARKIAAAIAKFDVAHRPPKREQVHLIVRYSALICRAQLWRRDLLLHPALNRKP